MGINRRSVIKVARLLCALAVAGLLFACGEDDDLIPIFPPGDHGWYLVSNKMLSWSPDGKEIAYVGVSNVDAGVRSGIYIVNLETLERRLVCCGWGTICHTDWSPDGERIAFSMYREIHTIRPDGTDLRQLTSENDDTFAMYSPDGQTIVFTREDGGLPGGICMVPSEGGQVTRLKDWGYYADWLPDGERLSLRAPDSAGKGQIAILHLAEDSLQILTTEALAVHSKRYPLVSPSGKEILFSANENEAKRISLYSVDVSADPPTVKKLLACAYYGRYSPDEKYLAYTKPYEGVIYVRDLATGDEIKVSPGPKPDCEDCPLPQ